MKVQEIRTCIEGWSRDDVVKLLTLTYRKVPKGEAKDELDEVIRNGFSKEPKPKVVERKLPNYDALRDEIDTFCDNAEEGKYYYANRTVSKKERSNWRNTAKRLLGECRKFQPGDEHYDDSNLLLCQLYDILGRGTVVYTFASQEPYTTAGNESQASFFEEICTRVLEGSKSDEAMGALVASCCTGYTDMETSTNTIRRIMLDVFTDRKDREQILRLAETQFAPVKAKHEKLYKNHFSFMITEDQVFTRKKYEAYTWFITETLVRLKGAEEGARYAFEIAPDPVEEVTLFILLRYHCHEKEDFIKVYEMGVARGIEPRDELKERYNEFLNQADK